MAEKLNEEIVKSLPVPESGNKVFYFAGATLQGVQAPRGFGVRVTAAGVKSFVINYRIKGKEYRYTIGSYPDWSALKAVKYARDLRQRIDRNENPLDDKKKPEETKTVSDVIDDFVARYVRNKDKPLRTADEYENALNRLVKPRVGKLGIYELRRSHVAEMLDWIEDNSGPVMADRARAYFRKALGWYAERDDQFNLNQAIVRVAPRANAKERARTRVLSDDEIRIMWPLLDEAGTFGALLKTLLLTAQRCGEVASMSRKEIGEDGIWTIPASRYKTKRENHVSLSKAALAIIEGQKEKIDREARDEKKNKQEAQKIAKCDYIFPSSVKTPFSAFGKSKIALDKAILAAMQKVEKKAESLQNWTLHDLRRTAKTLMMRAGARPDVTERVLGHVISGVEGVYDRHSYEEEKRDALERLATMVERIVNPLPTVVEINKKRVKV